MKLDNVVAAIILKDDLYLVAKRNHKKHLGLKWEFPGGKVEKNENFNQALSREITEELNIKIDIIKKVSQKNYKDEKVNIKIHYYLCLFRQGVIKLSEHEDYAWVKKNNLYSYDFVPGDKEILSLI